MSRRTQGLVHPLTPPLGFRFLSGTHPVRPSSSREVSWSSPPPPEWTGPQPIPWGGGGAGLGLSTCPSVTYVLLARVKRHRVQRNFKVMSSDSRREPKGWRQEEGGQGGYFAALVEMAG